MITSKGQIYATDTILPKKRQLIDLDVSICIMQRKKKLRETILGIFIG